MSTIEIIGNCSNLQESQGDTWDFEKKKMLNHSFQGMEMNTNHCQSIGSRKISKSTSCRIKLKIRNFNTRKSRFAMDTLAQNLE